jgi:dTMP kinase
MTKYIVFEGCDYTGKTYTAESFVLFLKASNINCIYTKEPGSPHSVLCTKIRELILNNAKDIKNANTFSYLFAADSYEHMTSVVKNFIDQDVVVVSDRSMISDYIYRPYLPYPYIREDNLNIFKKLNPHVVLMRASKKTILRRYNNRNDTNDFEAEYVMNKIDKLSETYDNVLTKDTASLNLKRVSVFNNDTDDDFNFKELFNFLLGQILMDSDDK